MLSLGLPGCFSDGVAPPADGRNGGHGRNDHFHHHPHADRPRRRPESLARLKRSLQHDLHSQSSERVMAGLIGLHALCAKAADKTRKPEWSPSDIRHSMRATERRPHDALRAFGAKPLRCADAPALYAILLDICLRAGLTRVPELFLLPCPGMNAYALGGRDNACISVTRGLLSGLSRDEIAGIFAHEVAHILHCDSSAMNWAVAIQREIADLAMRGVKDLMTRSQDLARIGPQALLLAAAPAMAQLLISALSRARELAADARAIDLIEHPRALVAALCKLEYFHTGLTPFDAHLRHDPTMRALHSHPGTWERIAQLA
nr:M48 family metalloprotease [Candidatus Rhodoblastus alkanivorans]